MSTPRRDLCVALVGTGDELVEGRHVDTNSSEIARALIDAGFEPRRFTVLGDDEDALVHTLLELAASHGAIIVTGGLGPTLDDVTRHAAARAAGAELVRDEAVLQGLRELFARRGRPFAEANVRQALFPRGADVLPNPNGTAAGFALEIAGARVFALPGPPREMRPMLAEHVLPRLRARVPDLPCIERRAFHLYGIPESALADAAGAWMARDANPLVGVTASGGRLSVSLRAEAPTRAAAIALAEARAAEIRERFGAWLFSEDEPDLARVLGRTLLARGVTVALAESCTGGLAAERLTRVPGISAVLEYGFVTYANRAKTDLLGVDPALFAAHGAVSAPVAAAMARGAAARSGARLAVSITGVAGPGGGTAEKPVGLVWFGISADGVVTTEERRFLDLGRDLVREFAANTAYDLLLRALRGLSEAAPRGAARG
ncbi:MAG: CinA family nicotinamide mononucleotide deamidase-related protein [Planctomycetota bacterium]|nr:CinA family nicotinamide mononucleotide deamidase-related protein [Planctomycetota bacterium]